MDGGKELMSRCECCGADPAELDQLEVLIRELCDALEWWATQRDYQPEFAADLIQRARGATK
jgi:hypothetical protein